MITTTWILNNGDCRTGISCVICGFDSPSMDTISVSPQSRKPKGSNIANLRCSRKVSNSVHHAMNCMVSKPLDNGR